MAKETMKAVVFKGPYKVVIEDRPIPKIKDPTDVIVKVASTALCGRCVADIFVENRRKAADETDASELHVFRVMNWYLSCDFFKRR